MNDTLVFSNGCDVDDSEQAHPYLKIYPGIFQDLRLWKEANDLNLGFTTYIGLITVIFVYVMTEASDWYPERDMKRALLPIDLFLDEDLSHRFLGTIYDRRGHEINLEQLYEKLTDPDKEWSFIAYTDAEAGETELNYIDPKAEAEYMGPDYGEWLFILRRILDDLQKHISKENTKGENRG